MMEHSAGAAAVVASTATATTMTTNGSLGENTNKQLGNGTSTSSPSTVCYLANGGGSGHIDRLNLVLPLSSSTTTIPITTTELIFSPTSQLPQLNSTSLSHSELPNSTDSIEEGGDVDRTPVNTATETKGRLFSFSSLASSTTSSFSSNSCRTVDSGTESLCSGDGGGAPGITLHDGDHHSHSRHPHSTATDLAADRILKFFASEDSKSSRFAAGSHRQRRRPTSANIRQTSTEDDDDVDEEEEDEEGDGNNPDDQEDVYSDESTLSESSVSPSAEFAPSPAAQLITPESVVAAIDAKIKQREVAAAAAAAAAANQAQQQNRSTMVTADKETAAAVAAASPGADRDVHGAGVTVKETVILASPTEGEAEAEAEAVVPISGSKNYLKVPEEGADYENDDELDIEEYGDGDGDDDGCGPPVRLIRSTSLKTGKTPPGTPRGKKIVRFADALGLDLESVRHIVDDGKPYMPPLAAFKGLALDDEDKRWFFGGGGSAGALTGIGIGIGGGGSGSACSATAAEFSSAPTLNSNSSGLFTTIPTTSSAVAANSSSSSLATTTPHLRMLFAQPSSDPGPFLERVRSHRLCLENCLVSGPSGPSDLFTVTCIARVLNVGFEKSLLLRYTTNEWLTWTDVPASYVAGSCDGFSDKFSVTFHVAVNSNGHQSMMPGQRLLFALRYLANGGAQEFWDNNMGLNYSLIYQRS